MAAKYDDSSAKVTATATRIDSVIDDDERLTYIYLKLNGPLRFLSLNREADSEAIYCELSTQENGIYTNNLNYAIMDSVLTVNITDDNSFESTRDVKTISIAIPAEYNIDEIDLCLKAIFDNDLRR